MYTEIEDQDVPSEVIEAREKEMRLVMANTMCCDEQYFDDILEEQQVSDAP